MLTKKDEYELTKEMLFEKFGGKCALCGWNLEKGWHIWNIKPVKSFIKENGELIIGEESYHNKLPACKSCNMTRVHHSKNNTELMDIEDFRRELKFQFQFISENNYFKKAIRYGIIEIASSEVVFYFEK